MWMIMPSWVCKLGTMENIFGLMTTKLGKMASRAFKSDTLEILEVSLSRIRGSKPRITKTIAVSSWTDDEAGPTIVGNVRTKGVNSSIVGRVCLFPKSNDSESVGDSMISLMTTEKKGTEVTLPRHFCWYSSQSFLDPTDTALRLVPD